MFDNSDRAISLQVPGTTAIAIAYDGTGRVSSLTSGTRQLSFTRDDHQRLKTITSPTQGTVSFDYDAADRITKETLADGRRQIGFTYDAAGNVTSVTPPARNPHMFSFTPMSLLDTYSPPSLSDATDANSSYQYNADGQVALLSRPDGATVSFGYDNAGRIATISAPASTYSYGYDVSAGRLVTASTSDGVGVSFGYDGLLLTSMATTGAVPAVVTYAYDASFRPVSESIDSANTIAFGYDNDDLLTAAGTLSLRRDFTSGLLTGTTLGNTVDSFGYNGFGEVTSYDVKLSGSSIFTLGYMRDDGGRIAQKTETANGQTSTSSYGYDTSGRLTDVTTNGVLAAHYGYDDNGNRTLIQTAAGTVSATYDGQDRLTSYNGASYFYSRAGELQKKIDSNGPTEYTYDAFANLRSVTLPSGDVIEYVVDAFNRRVGKKINGTLVVGWVYGDQLRIVAETDATGAVTKRFVYASRTSVPDYMIWAGSTYRIIVDNVGSPRYVIEATNGTLAEAIAYDEVGSVVSDSRPGFVPFGFAGGLYDADTHLVRFGARDYDPLTARWTSKDPIRFRAGDTNLYEYSLGDPVNLRDSSGKVIGVDEVAGAVIGGLVNTGTYVVGQLIKYHGNVHCISGRDLAVTFATGFVAGFFATDTFGASVAVGAAANAAQYAGIQAAHGRDITGAGLAANATAGALGGAVSSAMKGAEENTIENIARGPSRYNSSESAVNKAVDAAPRGVAAGYISNADPDCGCH